MPCPRFFLFALPLCLLVLAACGEDQSPTAPTPPAGLSGPAFSTAAGHRVVNSLADPGNGTCNAAQCTLREAIADPGSTDITFAPGLTGAITLARSGAGGGSLVIGKALTITGPSTGIVIRRLSTDPGFRILRIGTGAVVALTNLTLRNGKTDGPGGGIINFGTLALTNCTVAGNASTQGGGGIDNHGPLTLTHSTVANNSAPRGRGGGIVNHNVKVTLTNSMVVRNSAGGIFDNGGTLEIANSAVSYNVGGGIGQFWGTSRLDNVRIVGNSEGSGIENAEGRITLTNSTITRNSDDLGGGILNFSHGRITVVNSTISDNAATVRGGGIDNEGDPFERVGSEITLTNSTVSGNSAGTGGGIENSFRLGSFVSITNSTIASNSARDGGGGIRVAGDGVENPNGVSLKNSLVARNTAPAGPDVLALGVVASFSLIGDGTGSDLTNTNGNQVGNVSPNSSPIDPLLGPLADNGGPTRTHALLLDSPAIDAASTPDCPTTDQRGVLRPQGAACDIGSYERQQ